MADERKQQHDAASLLWDGKMPEGKKPSETKANILLVDEHPANRLALEAVLVDLEQNLVQAASGEEALRLLLDQDFAVVLLDVHMHGLDGFETAKRIRSRERSRHTPIIFLTAHDDSRVSVKQAYTLGAVDYLLKPLDPLILRAKAAGFIELFQKTEQIKQQAEQLRQMDRREFERKLAEENIRLRESEERFRVSLSSIGDAVIATNTQRRVTFINPVAQTLTGWTQDEAVGQPLETVFPILHEATRQPVENPTARVLREGTVVGLANHTMLVGKDGMERPIDDSAAPIKDDHGRIFGVILVFRDVSERRRAEKALEERKQEETAQLHFRTLFESAPGLFLVLKPDWTIVAVSDAYLAATRTNREEILGRGLFEVFPANPDDPAATGVQNLRASLERVHRNGTADVMAIQKYAIPRPASEGGGFEERYWSPVNSPVLGTDQKVAYIIHRVEDVTDFVQQKHQGTQPDTISEEFRIRTEQMEAEIYLRSQQVQHLNDQLRASNEALTAEISERKQREEALRESEERFRLLVEGTKDYGIFLLDPEGRVASWNPGAERIKGYRAEEIIGEHFSRFYPKEAIERRWPEHELEQAAAEGRFEDEGWRIRKDGSRFWANVVITALHDPGGTLRGFSKVTRDLSERRERDEALRQLHHDLERRVQERTATLARTNQALQAEIVERQRAEEALRNSEEQFHTLADSIPQLAWMARPDGHISWYNRRWYEYTGTTREQMEGWGWQSVHDPEELPNVLERWKASLATSEPFEMVFPLRGADGRFRWFLTRGMPLHSLDGRILHWFGTNTDITEIREMERALKEADRRKDEFLSVLSHELRTPLTPILLYTQRLRSRKLDEAAVARSLGIIEQCVRTEVQIVEDLLDISRVVTGKLRLEIQTLDLLPVIEAAIETVGPTAAAKDIELRARLDPSAGWVSGDPTRLQQIVWNLLSNAVKFTPGGGFVEVCLERVDSEVELTVTDSGKGIAAEFLPHVFERFRQADGSSTREHGGLGLGLAIVRHLVELHGGTASAQSPGEGHGATFTIRLPCLTLPPERALSATGEDSASASLAALDGVRVLLVEDEEFARKCIQSLLEDCGAEVREAASVAEALTELDRWRPDVLVSDIGMPGEDGYALIRRLRALGPEQGSRIPAVALTAYAGAEDRKRLLAAGFQVHVAKPVDLEELAAVLASFAKWTRETEPSSP